MASSGRASVTDLYLTTWAQKMTDQMEELEKCVSVLAWTQLENEEDLGKTMTLIHKKVPEVAGTIDELAATVAKQGKAIKVQGDALKSLAKLVNKNAAHDREALDAIREDLEEIKKFYHDLNTEREDMFQHLKKQRTGS